MKTRNGSGRKRRRELAAMEDTWAAGHERNFSRRSDARTGDFERTFESLRYCPVDVWLLEGASGEHAEKEFERIRR